MNNRVTGYIINSFRLSNRSCHRFRRCPQDDEKIYDRKSTDKRKNDRNSHEWYGT